MEPPVFTVKQAQVSLRVEIAHLMHVLRSAGAEVVRAEREELSLAPGQVWSDVEEALQACASWPEALFLIDGELLEDLTGVDPNLDLWLKAERDRLQDHLRITASAALKNQIEPDRMVTVARQLLRLDSSDEVAWRALMKARAARGENDQAIASYESCRDALAGLFNTLPSAETRHLLSEIRGLRPLSERPTTQTGTRLEVRAIRTDAPRSHWGGGALRTRVGVGIATFRFTGRDTMGLAVAVREELMVTLCRFRWLGCVSCASPGSEHDVDLLLTGTARSHGDKQRVSLSLIDPRAGDTVIWSEGYNCDDSDLLAAGDRIAAVAAARIEARVWSWYCTRTGEAKTNARSPRDLIRLAVPMIHRMNRDEFLLAGRWLNRATRLDPDDAMACIWLLQWCVRYVGQGWARNPARSLRYAYSLMDRAIRLEPEDARGLTLAGHVLAFLDHRPDEALRIYERAIAINPNLPLSWCLSGLTQSYIGNTAEGL